MGIHGTGQEFSGSGSIRSINIIFLQELLLGNQLHSGEPVYWGTSTAGPKYNTRRLII